MTVDEKKNIKILSGMTEVEIVPTDSGSFWIVVDGEDLDQDAVIGRATTMIAKDGMSHLIVEHFEDNVVSIVVPEQGLKVLTDGYKIEIFAPQFLKSRTVGLCGDMNGELSADIKTPRMCVMKPSLAAISYMLNKSGSTSGLERCSGLSGLPSGLKEEFLRESTQCVRETIIPTPISKQMVKTCLSKPLSIKQKSVEFACVSNPSTLARSLEKRALSGESLFQEISQLPTVFRKVEFEPVACKSEMSTISL